MIFNLVADGFANKLPCAQEAKTKTFKPSKKPEKFIGLFGHSGGDGDDRPDVVDEQPAHET